MAGQPIIRGVQAVGGVEIYYRYDSSDKMLNIPTGLMKLLYTAAGGSGSTDNASSKINTAGGLALAGFRLDSEFLRANPQIASSFTVPILGGGGVSLTNNNRTGTLSINCTRVSSPTAGAYVAAAGSGEGATAEQNPAGAMSGSILDQEGNAVTVYDMSLIAQIQQAQPGGDSTGATIAVKFAFNGINTIVQFEGCTVSSVDPLGLSGNDLVSYNVSFNYLNWRMQVGGSDAGNFIE